MADFVKGNYLNAYPPHIQTGIRLHRAIDRFTDGHPKVIESKHLFKPHFYLSSGVFTDILYDHFLANDANHFTDVTLKAFTEKIYVDLKLNSAHFTDSMNQFFGYMTDYNWLYGYKFEEGLRKSILGICNRYPRLGKGDVAMNIIHDKKEIFKSHYTDFFPDLTVFVKNWITHQELNP